MKTCPFCAEEIQDQAIKCRYCGEFLNDVDRPRIAGDRQKWYFRKSFVIIAVFCVGPLALPLIWWHPTIRPGWKVGLTFIIFGFSWFAYQSTMQSIEMLKQYYQMIQGLQ